MTIQKENYTLVKKDVSRSRFNPQVAKRIVFAHKITSGQVGQTVVSIDLKTLNTPSEMLANGFIQASQAEINGANLGITKKNLRLSSSLKGILIPYVHYIVVDSFTINLIGDLATALELNEILIGEIDSQIGDLIPATSKSFVKTVTAMAGQQIVNLGLEYPTNSNPNERIGSIKVTKRNGGLLYRNSGNSSSILDGDYYEVDSGNGFGTTLMLNTAFVANQDLLVEYGVMSVTDTDSLGTIQSIQGSILKIANDLATIAGGSSTDYLTANPSDIERRTFGDMLLALNSNVNIIKNAVNPVGTVIHSLLTEAQFQVTMGSGWVLADGRNVSGSAYHSVTGSATIPDMRGRFLRGKNNGSSNNPDGDLALGTYTADKYGSHSHGVSWAANNNTATSGNVVVRSATASGSSFSNSVSSSGSNETAPKSITTNIFVRIN